MASINRLSKAKSIAKLNEFSKKAALHRFEFAVKEASKARQDYIHQQELVLDTLNYVNNIQSENKVINPIQMDASSDYMSTLYEKLSELKVELDQKLDEVSDKRKTYTQMELKSKAVDNFVGRMETEILREQFKQEMHEIVSNNSSRVNEPS